MSDTRCSVCSGPWRSESGSATAKTMEPPSLWRSRLRNETLSGAVVPLKLIKGATRLQTDTGETLSKASGCGIWPVFGWLPGSIPCSFLPESTNWKLNKESNSFRINNTSTNERGNQSFPSPSRGVGQNPSPSCGLLSGAVARRFCCRYI